MMLAAVLTTLPAGASLLLQATVRGVCSVSFESASKGQRGRVGCCAVQPFSSVPNFAQRAWLRRAFYRLPKSFFRD